MAIRKDQSTLTDAEKGNFVNAVLMLKQMPSMLHPGSTTASRYDDYVELHVKAMMAMPDGWAHGGPAFFPWHRVLLLQFERDLQQAAQQAGVNEYRDLGVPYWDWTKTPQFPSFLGGDGDPAKNQEVTDGPFTRDQWTFTVVDAPGALTFLQRRFGFGDLDSTNNPIAMSLPDSAAQDAALGVRWYDNVPWDNSAPAASSFRRRAEGDLHNRVHRWVGGFWVSNGTLASGTMMQMSSPNDPVFWLHHANIDRLWSAWQELPANANSAAFLPRAGGAPGHNLHDTLVFGDPMPWTNTYTPAELTDTYTLGYSYDTLQELSAPPIPAARALAAPTPGPQPDPRRLFPLLTDE